RSIGAPRSPASEKPGMESCAYQFLSSPSLQTIPHATAPAFRDSSSPFRSYMPDAFARMDSYRERARPHSTSAASSAAHPFASAHSEGFLRLEHAALDWTREWES